MNTEPGAAILSIFDQLSDRIKQRSPARADDKPNGTMVYSQLVLGMPIRKEDYADAWTPAGGASLQEKKPAPAPRPDGSTPPAEADERFMKAIAATWKSSLLCRTMLEVTKDGSYREYPTGRHLDFAYDAVLHGMQPKAEAEMSPEVKQQVDAATRVLYKVDEQGAIITKTELYANYQKNAMALAKAKADFALAQALAQRDPVKAEALPVTSSVGQQLIDDARNSLIAEGADRVERALDVLGSVGRPMQAHMIRKAREAFDAWDLNLSGVVPAKLPFSMIMPSHWADADNHQGFETLTVDQAEVHHFSTATSISSQASSWQHHADASSGGGAVSFGFLAFGGSHEETQETGSFQNSSSQKFMSRFQNTAKNLHIELEYGLCTIERLWLVSDLFFLKNWFLVGARKSSVSDGTIDGQADSAEKTLPMIPQQFLVVRNVKITAEDWGSDGELLSEFYSDSQGSFKNETSSSSGAAGACFGFINFGGRASHSESDSSAQNSSFAVASATDRFNTTFERNTLSIPGAQIVGFLSHIVPACPDFDDPALQ